MDEIIQGTALVYKSYLLRLWRDDTPGAAWRATIELVTEPGIREHFADLDALVAFLLTNAIDPSRAPPSFGDETPG